MTSTKRTFRTSKSLGVLSRNGTICAISLGYKSLKSSKMLRKALSTRSFCMRLPSQLTPWEITQSMMSKCGSQTSSFAHTKRFLSQANQTQNLRTQEEDSLGWKELWRIMKRITNKFSLNTGSWSKWSLRNSVGKPSFTLMKFCRPSTCKLMSLSWLKSSRPLLSLSKIFKTNLTQTDSMNLMIMKSSQK